MSSYLLFDLNGSAYGVEAALVQEVFFLPELTPIAEAPRDIVGLVNLRGQILPVMDLNLRFGYRPQPYRLSDSVVVLVWQGIRAGIIVSRVREVRELEEITHELSYGREERASHRFVAGIATLGVETIALLDCDRLLRYCETVESRLRDGQEEDGNGFEPEEPSQMPVFCPHASETERQVFRARAQSLLSSVREEEDRARLSFAVVGLSGEYFGVELTTVREFSDIRKVTPVPCTPPHIIGNTNLRGEILTLIAIRQLLGLNFDETRAISKAIVVENNDLTVGITVDEVFDVIHLNPSQITAVPAAVRASGEEYLRGTAPTKAKP